MGTWKIAGLAQFFFSECAPHLDKSFILTPAMVLGVAVSAFVGDGGLELEMYF